MKQGINRRAFVTGAAGAVTAALGGGVAAQERGSDRAAAQPGAGLRAAVLEYPDRWTDQSTGLGKLLERAGVEVVQLDLEQPADRQRVDLIAFGSFTNNGEQYKAYVEGHAESLQRFVARGGVVLEMTQSDQLGNTVGYLPRGAVVVRGDRDLDAVLAIEPEHPLVAGWLSQGVDRHDRGTLDRKSPNWESFDRWEGMAVLLASEPSGASPCLLETKHGKGRMLVSSLWLDKCFGPTGEPSVSARALAQSEAFFASVAGYVQLVKQGRAPDVVSTPMPAELPTGPMVGHVDMGRARVWVRPSPDQRGRLDWVCTVASEGGWEQEFEARLDADHDFTAVFEVTGLEAGTGYRFVLRPRGAEAAEGLTGSFTTPPAQGRPAKITLGMGSCAPSDPSHIWTRVIQEGCTGFVFLGDTPYVDTSDLGVAREKHRRFLAQPEIREMIRQMPCWGTWDDHDFGKNDGHGDFPGKHTCRSVFTEYRANATFGHDAGGKPQTERFGEGRGIYTSFRYGPLEMFLLDPRWFSRTEPSWADPDQPTCLGQQQWDWFRAALTRSDATFKCIATGMIWDDKKNSEKDDWHTYRHEREAIFDLIRDEKIPGCFLLGGDIHVSRALNYGPRVGYDLWQFIVSPMHGSTIPSLNVPHPSLVHDAVEPYVFLKLEVDTTVEPATLKASWINRDGRRIFEVQTDRAKMSV